MSRTAHIVCALFALLASSVDAAINVNATASAGTVGQNDRGTRLDVFAFDVAPRVAPDVRSTTPFKTVTLAGPVVVEALGTVGAGATGKDATLLRARGRLRPPTTVNVTNAANETVATTISVGTYWFKLTYGVGGWIALDGGTVASGARGGSCVGSRSLRSGADVEFEVAAWDDGGNAGWHPMSFSWKTPLSSEFVEIPVEYLYAPLNSSCANACGGRACRVAAGQAVAECFVAKSPQDGASTVGSLESVFGIDHALYM